MRIIEQGTGPTLVLIPGLQGRWEYVRQAVDALSGAFRVLTFSLCDEPAADFPSDGSRGFGCYVEQVRAVLDERGVERAVICGISFGGRIALRFAAMHPDRTSALVLASTPGPGWRLRRRHVLYARLPLVFGPLFLAETPLRLRREMSAALPDFSLRVRFAGQQIRTLWNAPLSFDRMARRAQLLTKDDTAADCSRISAPTLVVTGERELDYVVPVDGSVSYVSLIRGARGAVLKRTGHLGTITHPAEFAAIVGDFCLVEAPDRGRLNGAA
jgi:pimeloyl-ACP methyl ester carboxylesterase